MEGREFFMVGDDPASIDDGSCGVRFFPDGTKPVSASSVRDNGERVSEAAWTAKVAARRASIAARMSSKAAK